VREPQRAPERLNVAFAALGVAFLAIFSWVFFHEEGAEWRAAQARFRPIETQLKNPHQLAQAATVGGLRQIWLPELDRVDRCTTCHLGIDDPAFASAVAPFTTHPGTWLTTHPTDRFGCTTCHDGQGQATDYAYAAHKPSALFDRPMRPLETIEANCGTCHRSLDPPGAPRLEEGRRLIAASGCVSCHEIPGFEGMTFSGPALDSIGYKVRPDWVAGWLHDPKSYLSRSKMGNFRLSAGEITDLQAFLLSLRAELPSTSTGVDWSRANPDAGRTLFGESRCVTCHSVEGRGGTMGPELTRIGDKVRRGWLFSFLKDPHQSQPNTQMLQYRLTDDQLRDLTTFLLQQYRTSDASPEITPPFEDPQTVAAGRATFIRRGCASCHHLAGIPDPGRLGPSLAGVADRDPDQLTYGSNAVRRTIDNYIFLKLEHPDAVVQPSLMPTFQFTPGEAARIALALIGLRKTDLPASYVIKHSQSASYQPAGAFGELLTRYRCLSCHSINGAGGTLSTVPFDRIGSQLQRDYIANYLLSPGAVRVSVEARMPGFHMLKAEADTIAAYADTVFRDDSLDRYDAHFSPAEERRGAELYGQMGCIACHQIGAQGGYVGPDLSNAGRRLKPGWTAAWLASPEKYKPGTLQPDYGLSAADARALTAYVSSLGVGHAPGSQPGRQPGGGRHR
jgi:mono/diheme cytochrome c family protein